MYSTIQDPYKYASLQFQSQGESSSSTLFDQGTVIVENMTRDLTGYEPMAAIIKQHRHLRIPNYLQAPKGIAKRIQLK